MEELVLLLSGPYLRGVVLVWLSTALPFMELVQATTCVGDPGLVHDSVLPRANVMFAWITVRSGTLGEKRDMSDGSRCGACA